MPRDGEPGGGPLVARGPELGIAQLVLRAGLLGDRCSSGARSRGRGGRGPAPSGSTARPGPGPPSPPGRRAKRPTAMAAVAISPLKRAGGDAGRSGSPAVRRTRAVSRRPARPDRTAAGCGGDGAGPARAPARPVRRSRSSADDLLGARRRRRRGLRQPRRARGTWIRLAELRQVGQHLRGRLVPIRRVLGHQLHDQPVDLQRQVGAVDIRLRGISRTCFKASATGGVGPERRHRPPA